MSTNASVPTLAGFDPFSEDFLRDPYPMIHRAQTECPTFYYAPLRMWVITRYADICAAARDYKTFSSRALGMVPPPAHLKSKVPDNFVDEHFVSIDPPEHTASRAAVARFFEPRELRRWGPKIREIALRRIDGFYQRGRCDLMQDFAYPLSLEVIIELLGVPPERAADYRTWTEDLFSIFTPKSKDAVSKPMPEAERAERWGRLVEGAEFFARLVEERAQNPRDDLISVMLQAKNSKGEPAINRTRIIRHINELVAAGNDTTANLMGSMMQFFMKYPAQFAAIKANPDLMQNAVEETLRRRGSSPGLFRITTRDVENGGATIPEGSLVWLLYIGGGLDESRFPKPEEWDIQRGNRAEHLAFGHGRHTCLGNPLARIEAQTAMQALVERIPDIRITEGQTLRYQPVMTVVGLEHLQVEWTPK